MQGENVKLKANRTGEESSNESELEELRQRLHQVEERELNAGQRITKLEEQYVTVTGDNHTTGGARRTSWGITRTT